MDEITDYAERADYIDTVSRHIQPGTIIAGRYEVIRLLGEGAGGAVFKCRDREIGGLSVALKIIHPSIMSSGRTRARIAREVRLALRINHDHVARFYDFEPYAEFCAIIMEYVDGGSLREMIDSRSLGPASTRRLLGQIVTGLKAIHDHGIVHRDLKPENILVTPDGMVKIVDFGVAHGGAATTPVPEFGQEILRAKSTTITLPGELIGTLPYLAPEYIVDGRITPQADIYALGAITYEMLTGQLFPEFDSFFSLLKMKVTEDLPPPITIDPTCPLDLNEFCVKALQRDPAHRFQSADECLALLRQVSATLRDAPLRLNTGGQEPPTGIAKVIFSIFCGLAEFRAYMQRPRYNSAFGKPGGLAYVLERVLIRALQFGVVAGIIVAVWMTTTGRKAAIPTTSYSARHHNSQSAPAQEQGFIARASTAMRNAFSFASSSSSSSVSNNARGTGGGPTLGGMGVRAVPPTPTPTTWERMKSWVRGQNDEKKEDAHAPVKLSPESNAIGTETLAENSSESSLGDLIIREAGPQNCMSLNLVPFRAAVAQSLGDLYRVTIAILGQSTWMPSADSKEVLRLYEKKARRSLRVIRSAESVLPAQALQCQESSPCRSKPLRSKARAIFRAGEKLAFYAAEGRKALAQNDIEGYKATRNYSERSKRLIARLRRSEQELPGETWECE